MNDKVDTRVVRMEFDNKQFEKNIKQTNKSLENLKQNLDFKGVGESLDKVRVKFSAFQIAATTFVVNLTNKIIHLGTTLIKSLSVDNIASGWAKFGDKTISVATMMAQKIRIAGEEITDLAQKTEVVNDLLEKLAWFADETSYSLSDMTNYASKFIAAGVDLDKAVNAMEGIATWAALAGQNSQTASRAMMQLAQAMGRNVNRQDWSSIQTANMDTEEFREKALETAVALGTLTKEGDKFVTKTGKKFEKSGFLNFLSEGWFTSDVLVETLNKYAAAVDEIYSLAQKEGLTASEVIEKYGDSLDEFGIKAFLAAQEARTFRDVINSVKDAVSSKWMQTFETFFGDKDESVKLWTDLANELYDVFAESGNFRNNMLSIWKDMGGRNDIFGEHGSPNQGAFWNIYDAIIALRNLISEAWNTVFPISEMEDENDKAKDIARSLKGITNNLRIFTENLKKNSETANVIRTIFQSLFKVLRAGLIVIQAIKYSLEPIFYTLKQLANQVLYRVADLLDGVDGILTHVVSIATRLNKALWSIINAINPSNILNSVFNIINKIYKIISDFDPIGKLIKLIDEFVDGLKAGGGTEENFVKITRGLISLFNILVKTILNIVGAIAKYVLPILDKIIDVIGWLAGFISGIIINILALISDVIYYISNFLNGIEDGMSVSNSIKEFLTFIPKAIQNILPILKSLTKVIIALVDIVLLIPKALDAISRRVTGKGIVDNLVSFFNGLSTALTNFVNGIDLKKAAQTGSMQGIIEGLIFFFEGLREILKGLLGSIQVVLVVLGTAFKAIGILLQKFAEIIIRIFSGSWKDLEESTKSLLKTAAILAGIVAVCYMIYAIFYRILAMMDPIGSVADSLVDAIDGLNVNRITNKISSLTRSLLKMAMSAYLLNKVDKSLQDVYILLITVFGTFALVGYFATSIMDSIISYNEIFSDKVDDAKNAVKNISENSAIKDLIKLLSMISKQMILLAAVGIIFNKMEDPNKILGLVLTLYGSIVLITGILALLVKVLQKNKNSMSKALTIVGQTTNDIKKAKSDLNTITRLILAMAASIGTIALAVYGLAQLDYGRMWNAVGGVMAILGGMIAAIFGLSKIQLDGWQVLFKLMMLGSLATSIFVTASSIAILAQLDYGKLWSSVGAIAVITSVLTGMLALTTLIDKYSRRSFGEKAFTQVHTSILVMVGSLIGIAGAIAIIAQIPQEDVWRSVGVVSTMFGVMTAVLALITLLGKIKGVSTDIKSTAISLVVMTTSLIGLAGALRLLAAVSAKNNLWKALGLAAAGLGGLVAIAIIAQKFGVDATILILASSMFLLASSLYILVQSMKSMVGLIGVLASQGPALVDSMSYVGEAIGGFIGGLVAGWFGGITKAFKTLLDFIIDILTNYVEPLGRAVVGALISILQIVADSQQDIFGLLAKILFAAIEFVLGFLVDNLGFIIDKLVEIILLLVDKIMEHLPAIIDKLLEYLPFIMEKGQEVFFQIIEKIIELLPNLLDRLIGAIKKIIVTLWNTIANLFGKEGDMTEEKLEEFFDGIKTAIGEIIAFIQQAWGILQPIIAKVAEILLPILIFILNLLGKILPIIANILMPLLQAVGVHIMTLLDILGPIIDLILTILGPALQTVAELLGAVLGSIDAIIKGDWDGLSRIWQNFADKIVNIWTEFKVKFEKVWGEIWNNITNWFTSLWSKIGPWFTNVWNKITGWFTNLWNNISGWFKNVWQGIKDSAKRIWDGFIEGLKEGWERIKNKFLEVTSKVKDAWNNFWGIHSPSRTFAESGQYMMAGLSQGLQSGYDSEKSTINSTFKDILSSVNDLLYGEDDDFTIKVGMDISAVESQTRNIQGLMSSISNTTVGANGAAYGYNARKMASDMSKQSSSKANSVPTSDTYNDNTVNNNVFNITSNNPRAVADEVDKVLQQRAKENKLARGGVK